MPTNKKTEYSDDKESLLKLIEVRKKEIDVLKKLYGKLASSTDSIIKKSQ